MPTKDPFLTFKSCPFCRWHPCDRFRYGGVFAGKFRIVHHEKFDASLGGCPFVVPDWNDVEQLLVSFDLNRLHEEVQNCISAMSPAERLHYDHRHFIYDYSDVAARIAFLKYLWENRVILVLRVPLFYKQNSAMTTWLHAYETLRPKTRQPEQQEEAALTDTMAPESTTVTVINPRWEHVDADRRSASPHKAREGDSVKLMVDITGISNNVAVLFTVYDAQARGGKKIVLVKGKKVEGVGVVEWVVKDPRAEGGEMVENMELEFDGEVKDKKSVIGKMAVEMVELGGSW